MLIIHALLKNSWESCTDYYGENYITSEGFIHCSDVHTFYKVAPNFADVQEDMLLLFIETDLVESPIKWEDLDGYGTEYPHIYGLLNVNAVVRIVPFLREEWGI